MEKVKERMRMICEAAIKGNVNSLDELLHQDPLILDRFIAGCFTETPLHIAAMLGRLAFAKAILCRKPEMAKELDFEGGSPLHLATASGHLKVVKALLLVNPEMCLAQNQALRNPLHVAVIKDRFEVLKELVRAKPEAAQVPAERGETVLHLCVKYYRLEALRFLVENICTHDIVNSEDADGFTALHLAVAKNQQESINTLITKAKVQLNPLLSNDAAQELALAEGRRNANDIRFQDSHQYDEAVTPRGLSLTVQQLSTISTRSLSLDANHQHLGLHSLVKIRRKKRRKHKHNIWLEKKRTALMVVASLIATMAFEAGINPPKGLLKEFENASYKKTMEFLSYNTTGFLASLTVILLLIGGLPLRSKFIVWILTVIMWIAIASMVLAYSIALYILLEFCGSYPKIHLVVTSLFWYALLAFLLLGHAILLALKVVRYQSCRRTREILVP